LKNRPKRNRPKSGRHPDIPEEKVQQEIKNELASNRQQQGWTTKQVKDLIVRKSGGTRYHYTHIYLQTHAQMGIQTEKVPRKTHVNTASKEEKEGFKKESERYCGYSPERVHSSIT